MVVNKIDTNPAAIGNLLCDSKVCVQNFYVSAKTGAGFELLTQALIDEVESTLPDSAESSQIVTNERQRNCLLQAIEALQRGTDAIAQKLPIEIVSAEVRSSLTALREIVGTTYTEDILGRIFGKFCIGK
jgi:tRNA modification GTPase